jgi:hydroxymethylpyrimidine pyrophosphatase-like HAD family hydrolase
MIFASDLDRTMIFSHKNFEFDEKESIMVDFRGDEGVSFITLNSLALLKEISNTIDFVPVSAREVHQIENIRFKENGIKIKHFIAGNGSTVVIDGKVSLEWENIVKDIKKKINIEVIRRRLTEMFPGKVIRERSFGFELFVSGIHETLLDEFKEDDSIRIEKDHRRFYVMFQGISKLDALLFLRKELRYNKIVASGDSLMDLPMIKEADLGLVCLTGDLKNYENELQIINNLVLIDEGIKSTDKVLKIVKEYFVI